jgi:hypothetical protein
MDTILLYTGLGVEIARHTAVHGSRKLVSKLDEYTDQLDTKYGKPYPCSGDFMCMRETVRHKADCPGKTESIDKYIRKLKEC